LFLIFREIQEAYEILGNKEKKRRYDRSQRANSKFKEHFDQEKSTDTRRWQFNDEKPDFYGGINFGDEGKKKEEKKSWKDIFNYRDNPSDPLNVHSEAYQKWEHLFYKIFPSSEKKPSKARLNVVEIGLRGFRLLFVFFLIQIVVIKLFLMSPANLWKRKEVKNIHLDVDDEIVEEYQSK
jgi:curved DNA-binding protein CbpA